MRAWAPNSRGLVSLKKRKRHQECSCTHFCTEKRSWENKKKSICNLGREDSPDPALLALWSCASVSRLWEDKFLFKPPSLRYFVIGALGNYTEVFLNIHKNSLYFLYTTSQKLPFKNYIIVIWTCLLSSSVILPPQEQEMCPINLYLPPIAPKTVCLCSLLYIYTLKMDI